MKGTLTSTWEDRQIDEFREFFYFNPVNTLTLDRRYGCILSSVNGILHTTPPPLWFENTILREICPNINT